MPKSSHKQPTTEHRAPDADAALEQTFEKGTALDVLPPKDRRPYTSPVKAVAIEPPVSPEGADVGSTFAHDNAKPAANVP